MQRIYSLNPVGELIWENLDTGKSLREICGCVTSACDVPMETAMTDVDEFVAELMQAKLITEQI
jgi:hypothetical protein